MSNTTIKGRTDPVRFFGIFVQNKYKQKLEKIRYGVNLSHPEPFKFYSGFPSYNLKMEGKDFLDVHPSYVRIGLSGDDLKRIKIISCKYGEIHPLWVLYRVPHKNGIYNLPFPPGIDRLEITTHRPGTSVTFYIEEGIIPPLPEKRIIFLVKKLFITKESVLHSEDISITRLTALRDGDDFISYPNDYEEKMSHYSGTILTNIINGYRPSRPELSHKIYFNPWKMAGPVFTKDYDQMFKVSPYKLDSHVFHPLDHSLLYKDGIIDLQCAFIMTFNFYKAGSSYIQTKSGGFQPFTLYIEGLKLIKEDYPFEK